MGSLWSKEPAIIVGAIVTVAINLVASLTDQGFISEVASGRATDLVTAGGALVVSLLPLITAFLVRGRVYSPASYNAK